MYVKLPTLGDLHAEEEEFENFLSVFFNMFWDIFPQQSFQLALYG